MMVVVSNKIATSTEALSQNKTRPAMDRQQTVFSEHTAASAIVCDQMK
jgi:hypothetical protein